MNQLVFEFKKICLIKDVKKGLGPLGGVFTAMKWVKKIKRITNGYQHFQ